MCIQRLSSCRLNSNLFVKRTLLPLSLSTVLCEVTHLLVLKQGDVIMVLLSGGAKDSSEHKINIQPSHMLSYGLFQFACIFPLIEFFENITKKTANPL